MKILIVGQAKTGTTALHYRLRNSLPGPVQELFEVRSCPARLDPAAEHTVAKILIGGAAVDLASFTHFDRKIAIIRDPRDRYISSLLYRIGFHSPYFMDTARTARMTAMLKAKESDPQAVSIRAIESLDQELRGAPPAPAPNVPTPPNDDVALFRSLPDFHLVRYEDMVRDRLQDLENYLGFALSGSAQVDACHQRVVRTKQSGAWRQWFTPDDVMALRPRLDPFLTAFEYGTDWTLPPAQTIEPAHCSLYYERLIDEKRRAQKEAVARIMATASR